MTQHVSVLQEGRAYTRNTEIRTDITMRDGPPQSALSQVINKLRLPTTDCRIPFGQGHIHECSVISCMLQVSLVHASDSLRAVAATVSQPSTVRVSHSTTTCLYCRLTPCLLMLLHIHCLSLRAQSPLSSLSFYILRCDHSLPTIVASTLFRGY